VNIGTTVKPIKNIHGMASVAAANLVPLAAGAAKLSPQAALHNRAECWLKNIALKTRPLSNVHSKTGGN